LLRGQERLRETINQQMDQIQSLHQTISTIIHHQGDADAQQISDSAEVRPTRITSQIPIMHSPGEVAQVANMFDPSIFEDFSLMESEPNIEFHIHAFFVSNREQLNRRQQTQPRSFQEIGVGPDGQSISPQVRQESQSQRPILNPVS
jgi:hypothetical protein